MTPEQKALVQSSFTRLVPNSDSVARFFYHRLFQLDPKLRLLFKGDMQEQERKLMHMIGLAVRGLDQPDALIATLRALGARHAEYGVTSDDYQTVGRALIATLEAELGPEFTPEIRDAWIAVYSLMATVMQEPAIPAACIDRAVAPDMV